MAPSSFTLELNKLIDKIYSKFILRDFFAKIIPGMVLLYSLRYALDNSYTLVGKETNMNWVFYIGLAWIVAFGLQCIGEKIRILHNFEKPDKGDIEDYWYPEYIYFLENGTENEKNICERLVIIKEATGNLGISLSLSILIIITKNTIVNDGMILDINFWAMIGFLVFFTIFLLLMHRVHTYRQCKWIEIANTKHRQ